MKQEEKVLTEDVVMKLGLDKVDVITSDMLEGYTSIGGSAFCECYSIAHISFQNSVKSIGDYVFYDCSSITYIIIPNSVTSIENSAFSGCSSLTSINLPNSVTSIGDSAFNRCNKLKSITVGNETYEAQEVVNGKCKAYKAFNADMTCRNFQYEEGKTYEIDGEPILCLYGFHACLNLKDVFNYYWGKIGKEVVIHEVELEGVYEGMYEYDSKVVARKITIGKRIL